MNEEWKKIDGFINYSVSNLGNVRNDNNNYIFKKYLNKVNGYYYITINLGNKKKVISVHRLVAKAFLPNPENKKTVNHKNNIRNDNILSNLEWATQKENIEHCIKEGRRANVKGEKNAKAKLTWDLVNEIRNSNLNHKDIQMKYNIEKSHYYNIISYRIWKI